MLTVTSRVAEGQSIAPGHVDPWPVLRAAAKAMGADNLKCVTFSGTGYAGKVGQNVTQDTDWPRGEPLANYSRTINYDARSSVEQFTRKPGMNPRSWKYGTGWLGGTPLQQKERQTFVVHRKLRMAPGWRGHQSDSGASQRGAMATGYLAEPTWLHQSGYGAWSEPDRDLAVGDGRKRPRWRHDSRNREGDYCFGDGAWEIQGERDDQ